MLVLTSLVSVLVSCSRRCLCRCPQPVKPNGYWQGEIPADRRPCHSTLPVCADRPIIHIDVDVPIDEVMDSPMFIRLVACRRHYRWLLHSRRQGARRPVCLQQQCVVRLTESTILLQLHALGAPIGPKGFLTSIDHKTGTIRLRQKAVI